MIKITDEAEIKATLEAALDLGYRHIDTAQSFNNEKLIGDVIKERLDNGAFNREDLFITSKVSTCSTPQKINKYFDY